jgi:L-amino acid N-acyltransferase YncA
MAAPTRRDRPYRWSCEVSIYLEMGRRRTGARRALYTALFARLADRGYRTLVAGMTLPNDASARLHRAMGFEPIGTYRRIG